jgi:hypothetical protein
MGTEPVPEDRSRVKKALFDATADIDDATFPSL